MTHEVPATPKGLIPPDERFWVRYSPHHELPLSGVSSFAVHALVIGLLLLCAYPLAHLFTRPAHSVPVEAVQLEPGGGPRHAGGEGPGVGPGVRNVEVGDPVKP